MTPYDAAMAGAVVLGMIWGAWKGITWQLASIASLMLGYLFAYPLSGELAPHFPGEPPVARALALMVSYVAVSALVFLVAWLVRATLRRWKFEAFDRHLGMLLGGLEGMVVGLIVTVFVVSIAPTTRDPIFSSRAGQISGRVLAVLGPVLPGEIRAELAPFFDGSVAAIATQAVDEADSRPADDRRYRPEPIRDRAPDPLPAAPGPRPWAGFGGVEDRAVAPAAVEERADSLIRGIFREGEDRTRRAIGVAPAAGGETTGDPANAMIHDLIRGGQDRATRVIVDAARRGESEATRAVGEAARKGIDWTSQGRGHEPDIERR